MCLLVICSLVVAKREEIRPSEVFFKIALRPLIWASPKTWSIPVSTMVRAMLKKTLVPATEKFEILENRTMHDVVAN